MQYVVFGKHGSLGNFWLFLHIISLLSWILKKKYCRLYLTRSLIGPCCIYSCCDVEASTSNTDSQYVWTFYRAWIATQFTFTLAAVTAWHSKVKTYLIHPLSSQKIQNRLKLRIHWLRQTLNEFVIQIPAACIHIFCGRCSCYCISWRCSNLLWMRMYTVHTRAKHKNRKQWQTLHINTLVLATNNYVTGSIVQCRHDGAYEF